MTMTAAYLIAVAFPVLEMEEAVYEKGEYTRGDGPGSRGDLSGKPTIT